MGAFKNLVIPSNDSEQIEIIYWFHPQQKTEVEDGLATEATTSTHEIELPMANVLQLSAEQNISALGMGRL